jgi:alkylhydroperoxidase family enzyme
VKDEVQRKDDSEGADPGTEGFRDTEGVKHDALIADLRHAAQPDRPAPPEFDAYLDKVRNAAYRVTDADVQALKDAGYSEDEIFEQTVAAAVGAGLHRLERGLACL